MTHDEKEKNVLVLICDEKNEDIWSAVWLHLPLTLSILAGHSSETVFSFLMQLVP